jgi:tetratricopeptide (TPR) repeat protein
VTTPGEGIAVLFTRLAAEMSREQPVPMAIILARLSTFLAPERADSWLATGELLARANQNEAALEAIGRIPSDTLMSERAVPMRAAVLEELDRSEEALELLSRHAQAAASSPEDWVRLGELYRSMERLPDAIGAYDRAIAMVAEPKPEQWYYYFLRGSALEQSGNWARAEADLRQAVSLAPSEPVALNYLGYSLLDRNLKLQEAQTLIGRAVELKPRDGHIVDSLGWAYYRTGQYDRAVDALERAIRDVPGDPTINEHLGDAYWQVGRKLEARFRWRAALDSEPTDEQRARLSSKLEAGLELAASGERSKPRRK